MSHDVPRPDLPLVLAVLTGTSEELWRIQHMVVLLMCHSGVRRTLDVEYPWVHADPSEATEALIASGVLPAGWCGDPRRGWHCEACKGTGNGKSRHYGTAPCEVCCPDPERPWERTGYTMNPRTIPDIVAVAPLGWTAVQRAEELARAACHALREYGCPTPDRVVWRVGERSPADAVLWRSGTSNRTVVSVRGVLLVDARVYGPSGPVPAIDALWTSGLALDRITPDAVVIVVPPVGGAS